MQQKKLEKYSIRTLNAWYKKLPGRLLKTMEQNQIEGLLSHIYGDHLVQIGGLPDLSLVRSSPIAHKVYLNGADDLVSDKASIRADCLELPLMPNSIDVIVLSHLLEFSEHPKEVLHEIYQALVPNGLLIILGFNPMSLWGANKLLKKRTDYPWRGSKFRWMSEIKLFLRTLGFSVVMSKTFFFRPPLQRAKSLRKFLYWEALGQLCAPGFGGDYLILAQKRSYAMKPLEEDWLEKEIVLSKGTLKPLVRKICHGSKPQ